MERPRVYIETTIPSFYCGMRQDPEAVARKNWTQHWWDFKRGGYEAVTSEAVLAELTDSRYAARDAALALLADTPLLPIEAAVAEIVESYIRQKVMPAQPAGDALHLAVASYHKCDFLLTWNCKHLANANKYRHIQRVNTMLGLFVPELVTPLQLLGEE